MSSDNDDEIGYENEFKENEEQQNNNRSNNYNNKEISNSNISNNNNQNDNNNFNNSNNDNNNIVNQNNDDNTITINNKMEQQTPIYSSNNTIDVEEEKKLNDEIEQLENEKQIWYAKRKEQNDILQKNMELLSSLSIINPLELPAYSKNNAKIELNNLISYNSKLSEIESEERILEEDIKYFEQYKAKFNLIYEEKQKELEKLKINYEKEKNELDKRLELLEIEEKMINEKYNNFEKEKKIMMERYNNVLKTESSLNMSKMRIENNLRELDRRNLLIERNSQIINDKNREIDHEIIQNNYEEKKIYEEKNNLKLRQEMVDTLRMKYVGDLINDPFYCSLNNDIGNSRYNMGKTNEYNNFFTIKQNILKDMEQNKLNENNNDYLKMSKDEINNDVININPKKYVLENYNDEQSVNQIKLNNKNEKDELLENNSNNNQLP